MAQEDLTKFYCRTGEKNKNEISNHYHQCFDDLMTVSGVTLSIKKEFSAMTITGLAFFPLVIIFSSQLKKVNEELKSKVS